MRFSFSQRVVLMHDRSPAFHGKIAVVHIWTLIANANAGVRICHLSWLRVKNSHANFWLKFFMQTLSPESDALIVRSVLFFYMSMILRKHGAQKCHYACGFHAIDEDLTSHQYYASVQEEAFYFKSCLQSNACVRLIYQRWSWKMSHLTFSSSSVFMRDLR